MKRKTGIEITNEKELKRLFKHLDTSDAKASSRIKRIIKQPFTDMRKYAKRNLKSQGSVRTGALERGLSVGSSNNRRRQTFFAFFGGRPMQGKPIMKFKVFARTRTKGLKSKLRAGNHFHLVNSGTVKRTSKRGNKGAVGRSRTNYKNKNESFKLGFADRAITKIIPTIQNRYIRGFTEVYEKILTENKT